MTQISKIQRTTTQTLQQKNEPIVCLTAYSKPMAEILDPHCDLLLVGDSIGMVLYGMENTLGVTLDIMINHGKAVTRGAKRACVIVDMPYGTYEESPEEALHNAKRIIDETGCQAVKLEGGTNIAPTISYLHQNGIEVMAHIGLQPQSVKKDGGYRIKGRNKTEIDTLINDAKAIEHAGAFAVVIEGTLEPVAKQVTQAIAIPTIGIGASATCDGQILVTEDMLGLSSGHIPKFVKEYANLSQNISAAVKSYHDDVKSRAFPSQDHTYNRKKA
ncbi:MAG: 3-methyl-2-oxobutanoate hydroxymethyltransferase [Alphaproteobacteria bacterium]